MSIDRLPRAVHASRLLSAILLAIFVASDVAGFAHAALHRHVLCAEHGVVEHASELACARPHARTAGGGVEVRDPAREIPTHEACTSWVATRTERSGAPPAAWTPIRAVACANHTVERESEAHAALELRWLLAPKQSPPPRAS